MAFLGDIPPYLERAIFAGLVSSLVGRISSQASNTNAGASNFEQDILCEDMKNRSFNARPFTARPTAPSRPADWLLAVTQSCCFSLTSVVCGLIYLDRLIKSHQILFNSTTWDLVWVSIMVLSEKFWEDNFIHPGHILFTAINDKLHKAQERPAYVKMQNMQFWLLRALDWRLNIDSQVFDDWVCYLRDLGYAQPTMLQSTVFVQRPIPHLKVRRLSQSTASTAASDYDYQCNRSRSSTISAQSESDERCPGYAYDLAVDHGHFMDPSATESLIVTSHRGRWNSCIEWYHPLAKFHSQPMDRRFSQESHAFIHQGFSEERDYHFSQESHAQLFSEQTAYHHFSQESHAQRLSEENAYRRLSEENAYRRLSEENAYRHLSEENAYRYLSEEHSYRHLSEEDAYHSLAYRRLPESHAYLMEGLYPRQQCDMRYVQPQSYPAGFYPEQQLWAGANRTCHVAVDDIASRAEYTR